MILRFCETAVHLLSSDLILATRGSAALKWIQMELCSQFNIQHFHHEITDAVTSIPELKWARLLQDNQGNEKYFCNYAIPTSSPLDYRMVTLIRLSDNIPCDRSLSSLFPHLIIGTRMQRSELKSIPGWFYFLFKNEDMMELTNSWASIFSSHLCSLTLMWEIPHGGEKPHLSAPLFNLAIRNHVNSNFTHRPYSRSDPRPPVRRCLCLCLCLSLVNEKRTDQMFLL